MFASIERPDRAPPGFRTIGADVTVDAIAHGFIGWLFAATAPVAIILAVGARGGLTEVQLASWVFGVFFINGVVTLLFSCGVSATARLLLDIRARCWSAPRSRI